MGARFGAVGSAKDVGWDVVVCDGVSKSLLIAMRCGLPSMMPDASTTTLAYEIAVVMRCAPSLRANSGVRVELSLRTSLLRPLSGAACPSCAHVSNDCG